MAQVVLITGASLGIGKVTAECMARAGYHVFGTSRSLRPSANGVTFLPLDVTDPASIDACVKDVIAQAGRLDILINNAGVMGVVGGPEEISDAQWRRVLDTNLMGTVGMVRAALPHMRAQGSGLIINLSSMSGVMGLPYYFGPYIASKHAIEGYTESLRAEVKPLGIRVALVELGYMQTEIGLTVEPPALPVDVYAPYRERAADIERYGVQQGADPAVVAQVIERLARNPNPPLRNPAGQEAEMLVRIMRPAPQRVADAIYEWIFNQPTPWQPDHEPIRRLFIDPRYSEAMQKRSLMVLLMLAPFVLIAWLWRRR